MAKIILGATVEHISTRQDNSFKVVIGANEIDKSQVSELFDMRNKYCKVFISDNNISELEEKLIDEQRLVSGKKVKTKSQRMRSVLFKLHESQGGIPENFDAFYDEKMESMIEQIKGRLN